MELQELSCQALLRLMSGVILTLIGLLLGLFSSSVAMASGSERAGVSAWAWLLFIGLLLIPLVGILLRSPSKTDRTGQPNRPNGSAAAAPPFAALDTEIPNLNQEALAALFSQHIRQCKTESAPMAVIAVQHDCTDTLDPKALAKSLGGLARSRGARLVQSGSQGVIVLAPGQTGEQAQRLAEAMHQSIVSMALPNDHNALGIVTANVALVLVQPDSRITPSILLDRLENVLNKAEQAGGNRVEAIYC